VGISRAVATEAVAGLEAVREAALGGLAEEAMAAEAATTDAIKARLMLLALFISSERRASGSHPLKLRVTGL
jgi:hypothetical protein